MAAPVLRNTGIGNIDELMTTSLENMIPGIRDNIFKSNPVFDWLYNQKRIRKRGGAALSHGLLYETNGAAQSYQRYDVIDVTPQDGMTRDQWSWAQYSVPVTVDGFTERVANAGQAKIEDIVEEKRMQAEEGLSLLLEQHVFAASPGTKDIRSLPVIVLGSGTEGGINGGTATWWQSQVTASGSMAAQGLRDMSNLWNTISLENPVGGPERIVTDQTNYERYENLLVSQKRFTSMNADGGFTQLTFKGTPITWSPQATSNVMYMLHSAGLEFIVNTDTDFLVKPFVEPVNQDARTAKILLACSLVTGNRRKLGKLTGLTA